MGKRNLALRANIDAQRAVGSRFYGPKAAEFRLVDIKGSRIWPSTLTCTRSADVSNRRWR